jgi:hypothetical protein
MTQNNRRAFFKGLLHEVVSGTLGAFQSGMEEKKREEGLEAFFSSYESSYALSLNYPDDIILESARMAGIPTEGREKIDIVKDLFFQQGGESHRP